MKIRSFFPLLGLGLASCLTTASNAGDWTRFRGENGSGVSLEAKGLPEKWSDKENLAWKTVLPGPGSSCPIILRDKVFVTCWSGYGTPEAPEGKQSDLRRHLVCISRETGKIVWDKSVAAELPEDVYEGMFAEHGYASHTPTTDGERIYAFFGKTGVFAFDLEGNQLWKVNVGSGLDPRRWGSACSPILYKDKLIVLAAAESNTIFALDTKTGNEVWKMPAPNFEGTWGTPVLVKVDKDRTDLVVGVPSEVWGFSPDTGKFLWFCPVADGNSYCSSIVADKDVVFALEGRGGSFAIKAGGKDDVSSTNIVWKGTDSTRIGTPVVTDGRIYFFSGGIANCIDATNGKEVYKERLASAGGEGAPGPRPAPGGPGQGPGGQGPGRGGRRGGGGMGGQDYGSPVAGDGKLFFVTRGGDMHVLKLGDKFEHLGVSRVTSETEDFSATPAIADDQLFVRSSKHLYCISSKK